MLSSLLYWLVMLYCGLASCMGTENVMTMHDLNR